MLCNFGLFRYLEYGAQNSSQREPDLVHFKVKSIQQTQSLREPTEITFGG